jgi:hypothetical protein
LLGIWQKWFYPIERGEEIFMLSLKEEILADSVAITNIMAGVFDWLLFKLEYSNNNNNKRPFSHSFETISNQRY